MGAARVDETRQEFAAADQMREGGREKAQREKENESPLHWMGDGDIASSDGT